MTDKRITVYRVDDAGEASEAGARDAKRAVPLTPRANPAPPRAARKRSGNGGRIAAAGMGIAAMAGLVANMEITARRAQAATKVSTTSLVTQHTAKNPHQAAVLGKLAVAAASKPIVLTPHAVVNTVSAPASGGGSYSGASYSAAPAASAPVASSGGSRP